MTLPLIWFLLNLISIIVLAFYSMMEMACVSFNKVRLQYYVSKGEEKAKKIHYLLAHSSRLFGTTLIGVNVAMFFGSEFSREFHASIGISPDLAPLTQVMIVIIFGELAPMFAARRYSEHVVFLGANALYYSAILMRPFLWLIRLITTLIHKVFGGKTETFDLYLNQEELKKILEERPEEHPSHGSTEEASEIMSNIFDLRKKTSGMVMQPIRTLPVIPANYTIKQIRRILHNTPQPFLILYHRKLTNITGVAFPRDLLRAPENKRVCEYSRSPWFISQDMEIVKVLHQFRSNNQSVAIILNEEGQGTGVLTLDNVVEAIFGEKSPLANSFAESKIPIIERTFAGSMKIEEFNEMFGVSLETRGAETLSELITKKIGHHPEEGESIIEGPFELQVKEATILEVKSVTIKTRVA